MIKAEDAQKRYAHLLGQTDIFGTLFISLYLTTAHFINLQKMKGSDVSALKTAREKDAAKAAGKDPSRRHRKTEKEEDEELLKNEDSQQEETTTVITDSPSCTLTRF